MTRLAFLLVVGFVASEPVASFAVYNSTGVAFQSTMPMVREYLDREFIKTLWRVYEQVWKWEIQ